MQSIDMRQMDELSHDLDKLLEDAPELRRELHEKLAKVMKKELDSNIAGAGMTGGLIQGWQQSHVGSKGGYAAVRPIGSREGASTGRESPGAITNYLENGHRIRPPKGGKGYRPRIHVAHVTGRRFYHATESALEAAAIKLAEEFLEEIAKRLEG